MLLPFASFSCSVMTDVADPFAVIDVGDAVRVDVVVEIVCATVTCTSVDTPPDVARTVATPFATAVASPVVASMVRNAPPVGTDQVIGAPLMVPPDWFFARAVNCRVAP